MNKPVVFQGRGWDDYLYWQGQDRKLLKRINELIRDIGRDAYDGIGKPEALSGDLAGFWSRRIDDVNRLVYRVKGDRIEIVQCRGHYNS